MISFTIFEMLCFIVLFFAFVRGCGVFAVLPAAGFAWLIAGFSLIIDVLSGFYVFHNIDLCCEAIYTFYLNYIESVVVLFIGVIAWAIVILMVFCVFVALPILFFQWVFQWVLRVCGLKE